MSHPTLPRLKKDRTANTFYRTEKYLRFWDGNELCCEHRRPTGKKCTSCHLTEVPTVPVPVTTIAVPRSPVPGLRGDKIGSRYQVLRKLDAGSFGELYVGRDVQTQKLVAIKIEQRSTHRSLLPDEYDVYQQLGPCSGLPVVHWSGANDRLNILVLELLNINLLNYWRKHGARLLAPTVSGYARQLLEVLEHIHRRGYVHRDLKPENIMLNSKGRVFLVDFGLAKQVIVNGQHIEARTNCGFAGTLRYMSLANHCGCEVSWRDDLEALAYVLIFLVKGSLPWQGLRAASTKEKQELIYQQKLKADLKADLPAAYQKLLSYARTLSFAEWPDYKMLRQLFA
jgi:casein kinase 1, epsilon